MTLEELEKQGFITRLSIDNKKISDTFALAQRDIATSKTLLHQDTDWAFTIAYNAILQTLRAFMFSKGYRPDGPNQHMSTVRFATLFLDKETVIVFDRMRRKRHASVYDTAGAISRQEAKMAIAQAEEIFCDVKKRVENQSGHR